VRHFVLLGVFGLAAACGSTPEQQPPPKLTTVTELPLGDLAVAPTPRATRDTPPVTKKEAERRHRARLAAKRKKERAYPPLRPWGIMDMLEYKRCSVGDTGTVELVNSVMRIPGFSIDQLDELPMASAMPGEGRHSESKGVPLSALYPGGVTIAATVCTGETTLIRPGEDWWLVKSTRGFIKGVRLDTRADLLRDITRLAPSASGRE
jgi:hypothetical protein